MYLFTDKQHEGKKKKSGRAGRDESGPTLTGCLPCQQQEFEYTSRTFLSVCPVTHLMLLFADLVSM